jgi:acetyl-CoA carboxylase biotin carboxyl carrier protein
MKIDKAAIRDLAKILDETSLTEIEVAEGDNMIRVARGGGGISYMPSVAGPVFPVGDPGTPMSPTMELTHSTAAQHPGAVISPMVGTAYLAPEPGKPPFVSKGATVKAGDTLVIIEAMKVMNPIKAERGGILKQILIEDARPVEFGDVMMIIE